MWRSRILWRFYAGFAVLMVATMGLVGILISRSIVHESLDEIDRQLDREARLLHDIAGDALADSWEPSLESSALSALQVIIAALGPTLDTRLTVMASDGTVLADSDSDPARMDNHANRPEILEAGIDGRGLASRFSRTVQKQMRYLALPLVVGGEHRGYVRTALALSLVEKRLAGLRWAIFFGALFGMIVALVLGYLLAQGFVRPLGLMAMNAEAVAAGDYDHRVEVSTHDELGQLAKAFNAMTDALRRSILTTTADRNKLTAILSSMVEGVVAIDRDERVVHMNAAAGRMLDIEPETSVSRPIWELTRISEISTALSAALRGEDVGRRALQLVGTPDRYVELRSSPLFAGGDVAAGAVLVLHDVTRVRRLERVRRDFVGNVSHELKTPVTAIGGLVETLLDDPDAPAEVRRRFLSKINKQAARLSSLVTDLLSLSRIESQGQILELTPIDVCDVLEETVAALQPKIDKGRVQLEARCGNGGGLIVNGEEEALLQAIGNLLDNAVKYSPKGGRVEARGRRDGDRIIIEIEDQGPGIEPVHHDRLFERFYRVDAARSRELGGTGLGLAIVKHIAISLGGEVSLESEPGKGATFRIVLPAAS